MLTLRLPDGSIKQVPEGTRPRDVAESIGKRLAQAAVAAKVNGTVVDLDRELTPPPDGEFSSGEIRFAVLTEKDPEALDVLRHSCAHVMARAVMRLFPGVKLAFGPAIENGFYYDIDVAAADPRRGLPSASRRRCARSSPPPSRSSASSGRLRKAGHSVPTWIRATRSSTSTTI